MPQQEISDACIQTQYEVENLLEEYVDFKNPDSVYGEDANIDGIDGIDVVENEMMQIEFEIKAQQLSTK